LSKAQAEGSANTCFGAFKDGSLVGFAVIQDWRHKRPIGGGVWRMSMGDLWGALGPIGVAASERGHGLGHSLLGSALRDLRDRGVHGCTIDWTGLGEFYGRHGFEITRRYKVATLKLD
jgi:predicted N-acetyltransferase YhbS